MRLTISVIACLHAKRLCALTQNGIGPPRTKRKGLYPLFGHAGASYFLGVSECDCTANAEFARSIYPASFTSTGNARFPSDHSNAASSQDFLYDCESL